MASSVCSPTSPPFAAADSADESSATNAADSEAWGRPAGDGNTLGLRSVLHLYERIDGPHAEWWQALAFGFASTFADFPALRLDKQLQEKRARWLVAWLQARIVELLPEAGDQKLLAYTLHFVCSEDSHTRRADLVEIAGGTTVRKKYSGGERPLELWASIDAGLRGEAWVELLQKWIGSPTEGSNSMIRPADVAWIAKDLDIDVVRDWKLTADFLELHTTAQLGELARAWKLDPPAGKRTEVIEWLLHAAADKPCPPAIAKIDVSKSA